MEALSPYVRILVRYVAGMLLAKGYLDQETYNQVVTDPSLVESLTSSIYVIIGFTMTVVTETYYMVAKRLGRAT